MRTIHSIFACVIALSACFLIDGINAVPQEGPCGPNVRFTFNCNTLTISGTGDMDNYTSSTSTPWYISGYTSSARIEEVVVEEGVTSIGDFAFAGLGYVKSISIAKSVTRFGFQSFEHIGMYFDKTNFTIHASVTSIADGAFFYAHFDSFEVEEGNPNYVAIDGVLFNSERNTVLAISPWRDDAYTIPSFVTSIGGYAFAGYKKKHIDIPEGIQSIGRYAFAESQLEDVVVPSSVTSIENGAFSGCTGLKNVTLPNTVTSIGDNAFSSCRSLVNITLPENLISIGNSAFNPCYLQSIDLPSSLESIGDLAFADTKTLTSVTIPASVKSIGFGPFHSCSMLTTIKVENGNNYYTIVDGILFNKNRTTLVQYPNGNTRESYTLPSGVTMIGDYSFAKSPLKSLTIPNDVTVIGNNAFFECKELKTVSLSSRLTTIGDRAFYYCKLLELKSLPSTVTSIGEEAFAYCNLFSASIPKGLTTLGYRAFSSCTGLKTVTIPSTLKTIGANAFDYASNLQTVTIEDGVETIGRFAFIGCSSITSLTMANSVTTIGNGAFYYCRALKELTIPSGVETIGDYAFNDCRDLTSITIPASVKSIGIAPFYECPNLVSIEVDNNNNNYYSVDGVLFDKTNNILLSYPIGKEDENYTIPDGVRVIGEGAFSSSKLHFVDIPDGVESIEQSAFRSCSELKKLAIPSSTRTLGEYAVAYCAKLEELTIADGVRIIGDKAFDGCQALEDLVIPGSVVSVSNGVFQNCYSLKSVTILDGVTSIANNGFYSCYELRKVIIPGSVKVIGYTSFQDCSALSDVVFGNGLVELKGSAFYYTNITNLTIPGSVKKIGSYAFYKNSYLSQLTLSEGLESIETEAFARLNELTTVTIPETVKVIASYAFSDDPKLTSVFYQGSIPFEDDTVFLNCDAVELVCVGPGYNEPTFCGLEVTSSNETCQDFRNSFNSVCVLPFYVDGTIVLEERNDVKKWKSHSNGCATFQCDATSGLVAWSLCNSTGDASKVCTNNKCVGISEAKTVGLWTVTITFDGLAVEKMDADKLMDNVSSISGVSKGEMTYGVESNREGKIISVIIIVKDESTGKKIEKALKSMKKGSECEYGVLCEMKNVGLEENKPDTPVLSSAFNVHPNIVIAFVLSVAAVIATMIMM